MPATARPRRLPPALLGAVALVAAFALSPAGPATGQAPEDCLQMYHCHVQFHSDAGMTGF